MNIKYPLIFTVISTIFIFILFFGIIDLFISSSDGVKYRDTGLRNELNPEYSIVIDFVPIDSPGYIAGLQTGDTIISVNGETFSSYAELNSRMLHRLGNGKLAIYRIKRNEIFKIIPVILSPRRARHQTIIMTMFTVLALIFLIIFYLTFPKRSRFSLLIFIFYMLILVAYIYSYVSFEIPHKYIFLMISTSFAPAAAIFIGMFLISPNLSLKIRIIPFILSSISLAVWFFYYSLWINGFYTEDYISLMNMVKIVHINIAVMGLTAVVLLITGVKKYLAEGKEHYIAYVSLFLISGFLPNIILYATPVALGKHEILSADLTLIFIFIPLLSITIYNNFFHDTRKKGPL